MNYILAHDFGTSGNKATLYDENGVLVKSCVAAYETKFFNGNWAEQNPEDWWKAVCSSTQNLLQGMEREKIAVVSFSGQMMGCLCLDSMGRPLRNSILYCDQRSVKQNERLLSRMDAWDFYRTTGHRASPVYSVQKLMWIKENEPEIYQNTYKVLNAKDYIAFRLTGNMATDYSDAGGTEAFDIGTLQWSGKIADAAGIDLAKFPEAHPSTFVCGEVTKKAAEQSGIPEGTPVVCGAGDGCAAGVGAGSVKERRSYTCIGSSAWVATTTREPIFDLQMRTTTFPHAVPGMYHPCGAMQAGGTSFNWVKKELCAEEVMRAKREGVSPYELMNREIEDSAPGANGVLFLPYLMGERSPWWNPEAKGAFLGLKLTNTRADMLRAVQEGVAYNLRAILNVYQEHVEIPQMTFVGGAAKGRIWRKIMADIYGMPIQKPRNIEECTSMGAAMIGGVGVGLFRDFEEVEQFVHIDSEEQPDAAAQALYDERFTLFLSAYRQMEGLFEKM